MELRALAERVLFGPTLEDKLVRPRRLRDAAPGPALAQSPLAPGRLASLALAEAGARLDLPSSARDLRDPLRGARVLHAFANHELQAMELFALALLRFPDAPAAWRMELAHVLVEEQEHLRLYLERMRSLGLELGEAPLSGFFWRSLRALTSPLDVVTGLGLTFEQANLDYALHYAALFAAAGDTDTAGVLERVHQEEVGHVAHGVRWLERWRDEGDDDWEAYTKALPAPLTPRRARGLGPLQLEARREAGLSERFLAELAVYGASKGRSPNVYWFVPSVEAEVADGRASYVPSANARALQRRWAPLFLHAASEDDVVLVPERPPRAWLEAWGAAQGRSALPELIETGQDPRAAIAALRERGRLGQLQPWGWSPRVQALLEPLAACSADSWVSALPDARATFRQIHAQGWAAERWLELAERDWGQVVAPLLATPPRLAPDEAHALEAIAALRRAPGEGSPRWLLLKAPFGASGSGLRRLAPDEAIGDNLRGWIARVLREQGPLRIEPWFERVCDLSSVFQVGPAGLRGRMQLTWPRVDARGRYLGHNPSGPSEVLRLLHGPPGGLRVLSACVHHVAQALAARGYRGPAGVDAFVARRAEGSLWLHPLVEVNPRWTFGHLATQGWKGELDAAGQGPGPP